MEQYKRRIMYVNLGNKNTLTKSRRPSCPHAIFRYEPQCRRSLPQSGMKAILFHLFPHHLQYLLYQTKQQLDLSKKAKAHLAVDTKLISARGRQLTLRKRHTNISNVRHSHEDSNNMLDLGKDSLGRPTSLP